MLSLTEDVTPDELRAIASWYERPADFSPLIELSIVPVIEAASASGQRDKLIGFERCDANAVAP